MTTMSEFVDSDRQLSHKTLVPDPSVRLLPSIPAGDGIAEDDHGRPASANAINGINQLFSLLSRLVTVSNRKKHAR
jgi:hypothetical protein